MSDINPITDRFRLSLGQLDPVVGDIAGNLAKARAAHQAAADAGADFVLLSEMFLAGYQTQDLVLRPAFVQACMAAAETLAAETAHGPALLVGGPWRDDTGLYNALYCLDGGRVVAVCRKHELPNDGVFDEKRLFRAGPAPGPINLRGLRIGAMICEDMWHPDVAETLAESGAEVLWVPNGSPYARHKLDIRFNHAVARVIESGLPLAYVNMVGAQDDQFFDGASFVLNMGGALALQGPFGREAIIHTDWVRHNGRWICEVGEKHPQPDEWEADYHAMVVATRAYVHKNGFGRVMLGLSGGIDSALVAAIATDALGAENVHCLMLPSRFTSTESLEDAAACARALGVRLDTLPIGPAVEVTEAALAPFFAGKPRDLTEENLQSRLRGLYLMAISNKSGALLLTTGNKSEMAVGYCTIYGDMNGAYNPLKDLYKTRVFEICRWRNRHHADWMRGPAGVVIPERIINKPPSAELRENQKDQDSLPPYDVLDDILERFMDRDQSVAEVVAAGHDRATVQRVEKLIAISEFKRFQAAPGVKLTPRALWLDRRYPITNRWRDPS